MGRDSSIVRATCCGLDGPESNAGGDDIFCTHTDRLWGPPNLLYNQYRVSFPGIKRSERCVKEKVVEGNYIQTSECKRRKRKLSLNSSFRRLDPCRRDQYVIPKRRYQTTLRCLITQKTEEFGSTAAEACDLAC